MNDITFDVPIDGRQWDPARHGWRCEALRIPKAVVDELVYGGRVAAPDEYEVDADLAQIRWRSKEAPPEYLVARIRLTKRLIPSETLKWTLVAVIVPVLVASIPVVVPKLFEPRRDSNPEGSARIAYEDSLHDRFAGLMAARRESPRLHLARDARGRLQATVTGYRSVDSLAIDSALRTVPDSVYASRPVFRDPAPPLILLMDSPLYVYDEETKEKGGTNADNVEDVLRRMGRELVILKEATSATWERFEQVKRIAPDLLIVHKSSFRADDESRLCKLPDSQRLTDLLDAVRDTPTRVIIYSRCWETAEQADRWIEKELQARRELRGRLFGFHLPTPKTFRPQQNEGIGQRLRTEVARILDR